MRETAFCFCCLGLVASLALADRQLQMLEVGGQVSALKVAQLGPDGLITKFRITTRQIRSCATTMESPCH